MTNLATPFICNAVAPINYRLVLDDTEALAEFDFEGTVARILKDFPGYAFTRDGRALTLLGKTIKPLSPGRADGTYLYVNLSQAGSRKSFLLHRMIARAFLPNPEVKSQVNHLNATPADNRVSNLEWATQAENAAHRKLLAKPPRRATPEQLEQAVSLHRSGLSAAATAEKLNIPYRAVAKAVKSAAQAT